MRKGQFRVYQTVVVVVSPAPLTRAQVYSREPWELTRSKSDELAEGGARATEESELPEATEAEAEGVRGGGAFG